MGKQANRELGLTQEEPPERTSERVMLWQRRMEYAREHSGTWFCITAQSENGSRSASTELRGLIRKDGGEAELESWERRVYGPRFYFRYVGEAASE
jgi:hypothetical protein